MHDNFITTTVFLLNLDTPLFFPLVNTTTGMTTAVAAAATTTNDNNNNVNKT